MNSQLIFLLLSVLLQGGIEPSVMPPVMPPSNPGLARGVATDPNAQCKIGYGTDPYGKYCMIIQIPPDALPAFSKGELGGELVGDISNEYRNYVERVIVRVGTGVVENSPPQNKQVRDNRQTNPALFANLDRTVLIDRNSDVRNTSAQGGNPMLGGAGGYTDTSVFPGPSNNYAGTQGSSTFNRNETDKFGAAGNPTYRADDFNSKPAFPSILKATQPNPNFNSTYQPNNQQAYATAQPYVAAPQTNSFQSSPTMLAQAPNFGIPAPQQNNYSTNSYPPITSPPSNLTNYGGSSNTILPPGSSSTSSQNTGANDPHTPSQESLLTFFLLFSIIGNIYLGLWMNYSRKRYRKLRSNMRGIPVSELALPR